MLFCGVKNNYAFYSSMLFCGLKKNYVFHSSMLFYGLKKQYVVVTFLLECCLDIPQLKLTQPWVSVLLCMLALRLFCAQRLILHGAAQSARQADAADIGIGKFVITRPACIVTS